MTRHDPAHGDRGAAYWREYRVGALAETAVSRRAALEQMIPKLKIAPRCSLTERYLVVRGDLRTYKVHLGCGTVLMAPNDEYLRIVPDNGAIKRSMKGVHLPFEGDGMLSIVLSKALLLAADTAIRDESIKTQIQKGITDSGG